MHWFSSGTRAWHGDVTKSPLKPWTGCIAAVLAIGKSSQCCDGVDGIDDVFHLCAAKKKDFETFRLQEQWWLLLPLFTSLISLFVLVCLEYSNLSQDGPYKLIEPQKMLEPTQLAFAGPKKMKKLRRGQGSFAKFGYFSRGKAGMCCSYFKGFAPTGGFTSHV